MPSLFDLFAWASSPRPTASLMAPLTRGRSTHEHVPTPIMAEYYRQRASAGLIITEATGISRQGLGWPYAPGIWSDEQVAAWKPVVAAVHAAGGRIFSQLWHMGRLVHPSLPGREQPVSASATTAPDFAHTYEGKQPYVEARALRLDKIPGLLDDYRHATRNALEAGFDGVQIHAANGYLIDQFLRNNSNFRDDAYGGSVESRMRLLIEVTEAVAGIAGAGRTAVRLSPNGDSQGVNDSDPESLFGPVGAALSKIGIAFLELREPGLNGTFGKAERPPIAPTIRKTFAGPLVLNSDYTSERAQAALDADEADAITFGRPFLANPDLPHRFSENIPLTEDDMPTWYSQGAKGYTDYPAA